MRPEAMEAAAYMGAEAEHTRPRPGGLTCYLCGKQFASMASLAAHISHHRRAARVEAQQQLAQSLVEVLNRQNRLLEDILGELRAVHRLLASLNITETRMVEKRIVSTSPPEQPAEKRKASPPSFLQNNPWVEILSKRSD